MPCQRTCVRNIYLRFKQIWKKRVKYGTITCCYTKFLYTLLVFFSIHFPAFYFLRNTVCTYFTMRKREQGDYLANWTALTEMLFTASDVHQLSLALLAFLSSFKLISALTMEPSAVWRPSTRRAQLT